MNGYRCYALTKEGKISMRYDIECKTDADAMIKAQTVADLSDEFPAIEVWCDARLVGRLARPPSWTVEAPRPMDRTKPSPLG